MQYDISFPNPSLANDQIQTSFMAENVEWLHFPQVIILSSSVHLNNLVSLDAQVQRH